MRLNRNAQARRYTLRVHAATREVVLTMPLRGSLSDAKAFAQRNGAWIATRLRRLPAATPFIDGAIVPLRGDPAPHCAPAAGARNRVGGNRPPPRRCLCVAGDGPHIARRVQRFSQARSQARSRTREPPLCGRARGAVIARITVRDTSSRWGSCSADGALSFSWRLILAPPHVLDYLAAHEAAHLVEMSHAPRFWRIVRRICPEMDRAKAWLDAHGAELHRYGSD